MSVQIRFALAILPADITDAGADVHGKLWDQREFNIHSHAGQARFLARGGGFPRGFTAQDLVQRWAADALGKPEKGIFC